MKLQEIETLANSLGFVLNYDQSEERGWIRFISNNKALDEKDLRWIWWMDKSKEDNLEMGYHLQRRLKRKQEIQDFLKY